MATLNAQNNAIEINKNYKEFIFYKYPILPKTYYDVSDCIFDLEYYGCRKNQNIVVKFAEEASQYIKRPIIFCNINNNKKNNYKLENLIY